MAGPKKPAKAKPIIDVAHPGDTPPASNSKSVIMGNHVLLKDPMVVAVNDTSAADLAAGGGPSETNLAKVSNKSNIKPLTAPLLKTKGEDSTPEPAEPAKTPEPEPEPKPEPEPDKQSDEPDKPEGQEEPETGGPGREEVAEEDAPSKEAIAKQAEADKQAKHQAAIEKLVDSKQYYLPINTIEKRRSKHFVVLGIILSLLLIVAWADIALDAGLIHIDGIKPVTHFFSN